MVHIPRNHPELSCRGFAVERLEMVRLNSNVGIMWVMRLDSPVFSVEVQIE